MKLNKNNFYKCCCIVSLVIFYKLLGYIYYKNLSVYIMDIKEKFQLQKIQTQIIISKWHYASWVKKRIYMLANLLNITSIWDLTLIYI